MTKTTASGGAVYAREFTPGPRHLEGRVIVDLGRVNTTAEVKVNGRTVGVCMARPDVSGGGTRPWRFYEALVTAVEYDVGHTLLFGSDYNGLECQTVA